MAVTIQHLEIRFDVDGSDEEVAFARLFQKYHVVARRLECERDDADRASERDRSLGDREQD